MLASLGLHCSVCTVSALHGPDFGSNDCAYVQLFSSATIPQRPGVVTFVFKCLYGTTTATVARDGQPGRSMTCNIISQNIKAIRKENSPFAGSICPFPFQLLLSYYNDH